MWGVALIFIAVANCNAELVRLHTVDLPLTTTVSRDHRIIGGSNTSIEKYPYAVQIKIRIEPMKYMACGGTLVTKSHVLTAAHCFVGLDESYERRPNKCSIREGTTYWNEGGTVHRVTAVKVHEYFDIETLNFDVALVLMTTPVDESFSIAQPIILPDDQFVVPHNAEVIAIGWGRTAVDVQSQSDILQEVKLRKVRLSICRDRYEWLSKNKSKKKYAITKIMMCAGIEVGGQDSCKGDSGGPLIYNGKIVGITSWSYSCAEPRFPGVYVDVIKINHWIRKTYNALSLKDHDDAMKVSTNGTNPGGTNPGSTSSLSCKIGLVLAPTLYFMLSV